MSLHLTRPPIALRAGRSACALTLTSLTFGAHAVVLAEAEGFVSPDNRQTRWAMDVKTETVGNTQTVTGTGVLRVATSTRPVAGATLSGMASAAPGMLKARIDGVAYVAPGAPNVPVVTHGTPVAAGYFKSSFTDQITLSSSSLAVGTPVEFTYTVQFHLKSNGAGHSGPQSSGYDAASFIFGYQLGNSVDRLYIRPDSISTSVPSWSWTQPYTISGRVGDVVALGASLSLSADVRAGLYFPPGGGAMINYGDKAETHLDASNTARFFLDAVTPGLTLVAESGHNYALAAAVPEPGTWLLMASGLLALGWRSQRRQRPAASPRAGEAPASTIAGIEPPQRST